MKIDFTSVAPYLKDPLILVGFFLFLCFLFARAILKAGIIPQLSRLFGYRILQRMLLYGFVVALLLIGLGFGLKYREISEAEQRAAVRLLDRELAANIAVLTELKSNTETLLNATSTVSTVLRTPKIQLLAALFPTENLDPRASVPAAADYADSLFVLASNKGLFVNVEERRKFALAAQAISGTLQRTGSTVLSLSDRDGKRYVMSSEVWSSQLPILRKVHVIDATQFQAAYSELNLARANYDVVVARCIDYLNAVEHFLNPEDRVISRQTLAQVLAAERLYIQLVATYGEKLLENMQQLSSLRAEATRAGP